MHAYEIGRDYCHTTHSFDEIQTAKELLLDTELLVFSGFSGTGKGAVCQRLGKFMINGKPISVIRSVTTRPPRSPDENYTFVSSKAFTEMAAAGLLLEFNGNFSSHCYGTPLMEVYETICSAGYVPLLEIDYLGLQRLKSEGKVNPDKLRSVFLVPPSAGELEKRLRGRGTETEDSIRARLTRALQEAEHLDLYDAVVVNDDVKSAAARVAVAFEGKKISSSFDAAKFREELREILDQQISIKPET